MVVYQMVQVSIIIGFLYPGSNEPLDCVYTDLYTMYKVSRASGAFTITICDVDKIPQSTVDHIVVNQVEGDIGHYHPGSSDDLEWHKVSTSEELYLTLSRLELHDVDRIMVYYSGHCEQGGMLKMPSGQLLSILDFRNKILSLAVKSQVFFIMDCCHSDHLELPYRYRKDDNLFKLADLKNPVTQMVMSITSSGRDQPSMARNSVSLFTKFLSKCIQTRVFNIGKLIETIETEIGQSGVRDIPKISVQASYPFTPVIWSWLRNSKYDIYISDPTDSLVIIVD